MGRRTTHWLKTTILLTGIAVLNSCTKDNPVISASDSDNFYVENKGASMHVLVEGNTKEKIFIMFVHGGPGIGSYAYNTDYISENLESRYAMIYWDQRNSGASQGSCNGNDLNFSQIIDDLDKVIKVIKARYGNDIEIFLMSHSFGGLVASAFITEGDNQKLFRGYINVDGSHNYPLNDTLTRTKLLETGKREAAADHNVREWNRIIGYCESHTGNFTLEQSHQLESYASQAENYIDSVERVNYFSLFLKSSFTERIPLTSLLVNLLYSSNSGLNTEISTKEFSSALKKITIPCLLLFGKYDFVCPPELGMDFFNRISSSVKRVVISPVSGHNLMFQDKNLFSEEVISFIEANR